MAEPAGAVESKKDFGEPPRGTVGQWLVEIKAYDRTFENWVKRVEAVVKRYRNESDPDSLGPSNKTFNILWSNIQTLQPSLYSRTPKADITRTHKDRDPAARAAAVILERAARQELKTGGFDDGMKSARDDYLLAARGQMWNRYVPTYGEETRDQIFLQEVEGDQPDVGDAAGPTYTMPDGSAPPDDAEVKNDPDGKPYIEQGEAYRPVIAECVKQEHINWRDFGHTPAPTWNKVRAVWKREQLTRDQLIERFGKDKGEKVGLTRSVATITSQELADFGDAFKRGEVYEIWDKTSGKVIWISPGYTEGPLDEKDDPLHIDGFFPCPKPLYGTLTTDSLVPVTDYDEYATQAEEIDRLTKRISLLTKALKVSGAYASDAGDPLQKILTSDENTLVPIDNWAMFSEKGGLPGIISWLPIKDIAAAIVALTRIRQQCIQDLYQISGLADIMRGSTDPNETLGAQRIKAQFGSMRLQERQGLVAAFARDNVRIAAEIIAEHFSPETLWEISGWQHTDEARALDRAEAEWLKQAQAYQQAQMAAMAAQMQPSGPMGPPIGSPPPMSGPPMAAGGNGMGMPIGSASGQSQPMSMPPAMPLSSPQTTPPPSGQTMPKPPEGEKPPNAKEAFDKAVQLLRDDKLRGFSIEIETDSMVFEDQQQEQKNRIELVTAVSGYMQQAVPAAQAFPTIAPVLMELLMFALRGFKTGRTLEAMFEQASDQIGSGGSIAPPPPQDGKAAGSNPQVDMAAIQAKMADTQAKTQVEMGKLQLGLQKLQLEHETAQTNAALEANRIQLDQAMAQRQGDLAQGRLQLDQGKAITDAMLKADANRIAAQRPRPAAQ